MIYAKLYRKDLINGEPIEVTFAIVGRGDIQKMHGLATEACKRHDCTMYRIYEGTTLKNGKAVSLLHDIGRR